MPLTESQIIQFASELTVDPIAYGYATMSNAEVVTAINLIRATIAIEPTTLVQQRVVEALDQTEYEALSAAKRDMLGILLAGEELEVTSASKARFNDIFAPGTTRTAVAALLTRDGSRAEELFGVDTRVTLDDVRAARA